MEWFSTLPTFEKVYWFIAIIASLFFVVQLVLSLIGSEVDTDLDVDAEIDADTGIGFHFFTLKNLVAFFTIFGWVGLACIEKNYSNGFTILFSVLSGLAMMTVMAWLYYLSSKLKHNGTMNIKNALNQVGEVYLTIPANQSGKGKVMINVQGAVRELEALTKDNQDIKTGEIIEVVSIENKILIVTKK